ncbi:MAG: tRNA-dihydrouridine synthase family protein [Oscillospiraceae bacterium]|nr:tRNA-dihydrouridine synthase family protein [Oscillospiraceae bacterium]
MEGLTDSIFRLLHHKYFPGVDRYYTPFFSPTVHRALTPKEARELPPAASMDFNVVPQLLTKVPEDFLWMAQQCKDLGYGEVNLNLGCPSGTVTAKGKGSGMLRDLDALKRFLEEIFSQTPIDISIKTRIGFASPVDFPALLDIFNCYPVKELTVHPRVRSQFYSGMPDMDAFTYAVQNSKTPLCYNGDLRSLSEVAQFSQKFPQIDAVMIGRGLLADPGMLTPGGTDVKALEAFYEELLEEYLVAFGGSRNAMFRLKEHWGLLIHRFEGSEKLGKRLRKTTDLGEYKAITQEIFHTLPFKN